MRVLQKLTFVGREENFRTGNSLFVSPLNKNTYNPESQSVPRLAAP